jgi:choline dehydrogenase
MDASYPASASLVGCHGLTINAPLTKEGKEKNMTNTKKGLMESESKEFAERIRKNQQKLSSELRTKFDYIVVGAGTSGSVVAGRLASDLNTQVLLLEAGGSDETELISNPNRWPMTLGSEFDWSFMTEPDPKLNGRSLRYSMGKVLGGGSSINVSTWSRGHQADWDFYTQESGDPSWSYRAVLDLYRRRIEAWAGKPDPDYRGMHGTVHVQPAADPQPFAFAFLEAAESVGIHRFPDPNGWMMEADRGCALVDETVRNGTRQSIFRSYVYPLLTKQNSQPQKGSHANFCLQMRARPSMPFLKSIASTATRMRTCGTIWITAPSRTAEPD